ncbi:hypothetical protein EAO75_42855, partial [Streptomyces sp. uw30]|uniref:trypsin-like serine protease n=1 Tax=Streptomyces sp. uw30 TaxID=1828179 RepID=UPI0011CD62D7
MPGSAERPYREPRITWEPLGTTREPRTVREPRITGKPRTIGTTRQLKQLDTRVLPAQDCPGIKGGGELCFAGTPTDTACYGDSGGPAVVQD